jgi:membrane protease subunit HflK
MFLETMERVFGGMDKVIIDQRQGGTGVVPYLPLDQLQRTQKPAQGQNAAGQLQGATR